MNISFHLYNFIAGTCILVVIAYLLVRGRMLNLLFKDNLTRREVFRLGLIMGLLGLMESIFPIAELPYSSHTLFVIFASIIGGLQVGLVTSAVVTIGAFFFQTHNLVFPTMLAMVISAFLGKLVRRTDTIPSRLAGGFLVGVLAQAGRLFLRTLLTTDSPTLIMSPAAWISAPVNGFGIALLLLVISDAQIRSQSERASALLTQAQLTALRARIRPHFLFNTLNSIAELCRIAPDRAEEAILRLSYLMRHALESSVETTNSLEEEVEVAQAYLSIEQERLGDRLHVMWQRDALMEQIPVPPFALQTLVENALNHGLSRKKGAVTIEVTLLERARHTLVAVRDDGVGMNLQTRRGAIAEENNPSHGLQILNQHLILLYGRQSRVRLFSREGEGTIAAFMVPTGI